MYFEILRRASLEDSTSVPNFIKSNTESEPLTFPNPFVGSI